MTNQLQKIEGVLFDLDGTLIDSYEAILRSMQYAMDVVLGKSYPPDFLMKKVGQPLRTQMMDYARSEEECEELLRVYRAYQATIHDEVVTAFEGTRATLEVLAENGYPLGVVTSKMHAPALHGLQLCGLDTFFSCLVGADDCASHKPDPGPVEYGAQLLGLDVRKCVYVGDSRYDIQAGNSAGAVTVAALWGMFSPEELESAHPDYSCSSIEYLISLLGL